tara:strand:+ start:255 stop:431 length:177 start_codon:yes stop_codon:yes gene_type:complete
MFKHALGAQEGGAPHERLLVEMLRQPQISQIMYRTLNYLSSFVTTGDTLTMLTQSEHM